MCKHIVYTTIVNFQMNIVYRRKIKNRKKQKTKTKKLPNVSVIDFERVNVNWVLYLCISIGMKRMPDRLDQ